MVCCSHRCDADAMAVPSLELPRAGQRSPPMPADFRGKVSGLQEPVTWPLGSPVSRLELQLREELAALRSELAALEPEVRELPPARELRELHELRELREVGALDLREPGRALAPVPRSSDREHQLRERVDIHSPCRAAAKIHSHMEPVTATALRASPERERTGTPRRVPSKRPADMPEPSPVPLTGLRDIQAAPVPALPVPHVNQVEAELELAELRAALGAERELRESLARGFAQVERQLRAEAGAAEAVVLQQAARQLQVQPDATLTLEAVEALGKMALKPQPQQLNGHDQLSRVLAAGRALAVQSQVLMQRLQTLALHLGSGRRVVCSMAQSRTEGKSCCAIWGGEWAPLNSEVPKLEHALAAWQLTVGDAKPTVSRLASPGRSESKRTSRSMSIPSPLNDSFQSKGDSFQSRGDARTDAQSNSDANLARWSSTPLLIPSKDLPTTQRSQRQQAAWR
ncbi:unnamed protein product [Effrenium voratum]|nr:unnamed protein product [Effrenium voratum]